MTPDLLAALDGALDHPDFSGAVRVSFGGEVIYERACGLADRAHAVPMTVSTQCAIASASKGFTALTTMSLVADGSLSLGARVRDLVGDVLDFIDPAVTVAHLLAHTSGIGDYVDEDELSDIGDYVMPVPVHQLAATRGYIPALRGHPQKFAPGDRFAYCNSGYVVVALVIEAVTGSTFHHAVQERVFDRAGMRSTAYLRSDQLPGSAAIGYVPADDAPGWRTNVLHLPVRGSGDGGAYSTLGDLASFWASLFDGRIVERGVVDLMTTARSPAPDGAHRYGLGFWLMPAAARVWLEGYDAGVSCWSSYVAAEQLQCTVVSNTSEGAWPPAKLLQRFCDTRGS